MSGSSLVPERRFRLREGEVLVTCCEPMAPGLVVTHLYPEMDRVGLGEAFDGFEGEVRVAEDGTTLTLSET